MVSPVDFAHGRVFYVELFSDPPTITQLNYELPAPLRDRKYDKIVRKLSEELGSIENVAPEIKRVLDRKSEQPLNEPEEADGDPE